MLTSEERSRRLLEDGFRLSEEGKLQSAIHACQQAVALNPTSTSAHSLLGTLYERVGDRDGAIREYEQVLTLSPGSTVERRRLNELMGVAAAPEPVVVSPRTARMAVTGGFVVLALILVGALIFTGQQPERGAGKRVVARAPSAAQQPAPFVAESFQGAPPRLLGSGRVRAPRAAPARTAQQPAVRVQRPTSQAYGQWIGPGAFLLPAGGREPYAAMGAGRVAHGGYAARPIQGAVLVRASGTPTVSTPGWRYPSGISSVPSASVPRLARNYYYQGNYQAAIEAYRGYLVANPREPEPRQELAWVYMDSGDRPNAKQQYQVALDQYQADLDRKHNVEAARHGARTCESAIDALETE